MTIDAKTGRRTIDCPHSEDAIVEIDRELTLVHWCSRCGSIRDNNGDHGAPAGVWRAPELAMFSS